MQSNIMKYIWLLVSIFNEISLYLMILLQHTVTIRDKIHSLKDLTGIAIIKMVELIRNFNWGLNVIKSSLILVNLISGYIQLEMETKLLSHIIPLL
jgi:hypothetical protein